MGGERRERGGKGGEGRERKGSGEGGRERRGCLPTAITGSAHDDTVYYVNKSITDDIPQTADSYY